MKNEIEIEKESDVESITEEIKDECQEIESKHKLSTWVYIVIVIIVAFTILIIANQTGPIIRK